MYVKAFIEGKFIRPSSKLKDTVIISPCDGKTVAHFKNLNNKDVEKAFNYAAALQDTWRNVEPIKKIQIFNKFVILLKKHKDEFANRMMQEIAKSKKDCYSEVDRTCDLIIDTIKHFTLLLDATSYGDINKPNKIAFFTREPLGVVLAISPFNYPLNLAVSKIVPSLIVGNTVVFKSATQGTWTGGLIVELLYKAGLPKGVLQFITGRGREIGNDLVSNKHISLINFTGSYKTGLETARLNPMAKKIYELSGKDPAIILENGDLEVAINAIIKGAFSYSGQRCTAIKRIIVHESRLLELESKLYKRMTKLSVSKNVHLNPDIVPLIDEKSAHFIKSLYSDAVNKGAKIILDGKFEGTLVHPILLSNVKKNMDIYYVEQFGPILPIISFKSNMGAIEISNDSLFGLGGAVFTESYKDFLFIAKRMKTGRVTWNATPSRGPDNFPFNGIKHSGTGIQGIKHVLLESTYPKGYVLT